MLPRWRDAISQYLGRGVGPFLLVLRALSARTCYGCALALLGTLLVSQLPAALAYLTKAVVDGLSSKTPPVHLLENVVAVPLLFGYAYLVVFLSQNIAQALMFSVGEHLAEQVSHDVHLSVIRRAMRIPGLRYFDTPELYDKRIILERNAFHLPVALLRVTTDVCGSLGAMVGMAFVLCRVNPLIPFVIVACSIPDLLALKRIHRLTYEGIMETAEEERLREYYRSILTTREYANEVRLFQLTEYFLARYRDSLARTMAILSPIRRKHVTMAALSRLIFTLGTVGAYVWIIEKALHDSMSIGLVAMFITAVLVIHQQITRLSQTLAGHQDIFSTVRVLADWLNMKPDLTRIGIDVPVVSRRSPAPAVRIENLWFKYPGAADFTLKGLTLEIPAGRSLAIVGPNGCGKTTLVKLLCRLYDPEQGRILYDESDIRVIPIGSLRGATAVVFQDFLQYEMSAAENIALSTDMHKRTLDAIREAAQRAGAAEFLEDLPKGYMTVLGRQFPGGVDLSRGQWQRIALARAYFRDKGLLILDEPTAAQDVDTEAYLYAHFRKMTAGKTSLLISHRLCTVRTVDQIAVINDGRVVEQGTHDTLMALDGLYAQMFMTQAQRYRHDDWSDIEENDAKAATADAHMDLSV